jgi:formylglycine-generating enzyme required for sulfatase activity
MATNPSSLPNGYKLSEYKIDDVLGQGGFGITYLATDTMLNRQVAIKEYYPREFAVREGTRRILASGNQEDQETFAWGLTKFLEEARILARFEHPNIIAVRRFFEKNGTAYLVMDYCDGRPLDEIIQHDGPLSPAQLDLVLNPLLDGLEQIHNSNFLHRDIKPANLFIRSDGSPVLLDFGAARHDLVGHSRSLTTLATPGYAAFEQYSTNGRQGPWTDIYGLGATLYRAVTGVKPVPSPDRVLEDTLEPASELAKGRFPANLLLAIDAALAVRPERRPQSVASLRLLLNKTSSPSGAKKTPPLRQTSPIPASDKSVPDFTWKDKLKLIWDIDSSLKVTINLIIGAVVLVFISWSLRAFYVENIQRADKLADPSPIKVEAAKSPSDDETLEIQDCDDCPIMVKIPAGNFAMGSPVDEPARSEDEGPQHRITINRFFYVGKFEVTLKQWEACVREQGCSHNPRNEVWSRESSPVTDVSWFDALAYVNWLSSKTGRNYRLLSEAEWEYAARAGSKTAYSFGPTPDNLSSFAWFESNSKNQPHLVGEKLGNEFGLYDMHGNVMEWTQDCWNQNYIGAPADGRPWTNGVCSQRVLRGGSWAGKPEQLRSSSRNSSSAAESRYSDLGFRVAITP